jgi:hypothetical protein
MKYGFSFIYYPKNSASVELQVTSDHVEEAAAEVFKAYAKRENGGFDLTEAIECVCGAFWKEGEANALDCLIGEGDFWSYIKENTDFFESEKVIDVASEKSIEEYKSRIESYEM